MGIIMMFSGILFKEKKGLATLACILLAVLLGVNIWELVAIPKSAAARPISLFHDMLRIDRYAQWFNTLMTGCTFLYVLLSGRDIRKVGGYVAEYFALIFFILCGVYLLSSYNTLLMLFIGIEILSIPQYILAGSDKKNLKSSEAALKYFLMGSFSTGILLMGIALLYGATGTFHIDRFDFLLRTFSPMGVGGILLLIISFGFKVSAAPMHLWTPDVYDGSPTPFTAYMSTVVKAAAFFAFLRLFHSSFGNLTSQWTLVLAIVTAATLLVGNVTAVFQQSVKRMLAYSSIAQAGFMLFAVLNVTAIAWQGIIIYAVAYSVASIGLFAVLMKLKDYTYDGFNGLARREPGLALCATIFILSLAGIPLTGGFMAKYYVLYSFMQQDQMVWWMWCLVIFALLMAAISAYYYFRVIMAMYFKQGSPELHEPLAIGDRFLIGLTAVLVIVIGTVPQLLLQVVSK